MASDIEVWLYEHFEEKRLVRQDVESSNARATFCVALEWGDAREHCREGRGVERGFSLAAATCRVARGEPGAGHTLAARERHRRDECPASRSSGAGHVEPAAAVLARS